MQDWGLDQFSHLLSSNQQDAVFLAVLDLAVDVVQHQQLAPTVLQQCHLVSHLEGRIMQRSSQGLSSGPFSQLPTQNPGWSHLPSSLLHWDPVRASFRPQFSL